MKLLTINDNYSKLYSSSLRVFCCMGINFFVLNLKLSYFIPFTTAKFSCDEKKFLTILRGLPGSGKTHLAR